MIKPNPNNGTGSIGFGILKWLSLDKMFQHGATYPSLTPFKQKVQKAVNFILEYKTTDQHLSCNMLFVSLLCVRHLVISGQNLVMHE